MTQMTQDAIYTRSVNTIRCLAADTVQKANSGHPGAPMGCAPMAHVLFAEFAKMNPSNPNWMNRDRFVLSNGHGCVLQYVLWHLLGFNISLEDLQSFRQLGSKYDFFMITVYGFFSFILYFISSLLLAPILTCLFPNPNTELLVTQKPIMVLTALKYLQVPSDKVSLIP